MTILSTLRLCIDLKKASQMTLKVGSNQNSNTTFALQTKVESLMKGNTSSTALQFRATEASQPMMHQESVKLDTILTQHDKQVLNYAVGGVELKGADGMMKLNFMGIRIALDRTTGELSGEVDSAYMRRIAQSQNLTGDHSIASSAIDRAIEFLDRI